MTDDPGRDPREGTDATDPARKTHAPKLTEGHAERARKLEALREAAARGEEVDPLAALKLRYHPPTAPTASRQEQGPTPHERGRVVALDEALTRRLDSFCDVTGATEEVIVATLLRSFLDAWEQRDGNPEDAPATPAIEPHAEANETDPVFFREGGEEFVLPEGGSREDAISKRVYIAGIEATRIHRRIRVRAREEARARALLLGHSNDVGGEDEDK